MFLSIKKLSIVISTFFFLSNTFAGFGVSSIGNSAKSRAMAGAGTALNVGAESILKNPALLATDQEASFEFMLTRISVDISAKNKDAELIGKTSKEIKSESDEALLPAIGFVKKYSDKITWGIGLFVFGGGSVDYRDEGGDNGLSAMYTFLALQKLTPAMSYKVNENFSLGLGLQVLHGELSSSYNAGSDTGRGVSLSDGVGLDLGLAYKSGNFTYGFNYQSEIYMKYDHQLKKAAEDFQAGDEVDGDKLSQPSEMALGVTYQHENWLVTADYKQINWGQTSNWKELGWENQNIMSVAGSYTKAKNTFRLGYNQANSPLGDEAVKNEASASPNNRQSLNVLNIVGFPGITKVHYTFGYERKVSKDFSFDLAYVMSPAESVSGKSNVGQGDMEIETNSSFSSLTVGAKWNF